MLTGLDVDGGSVLLVIVPAMIVAIVTVAIIVAMTIVTVITVVGIWSISIITGAIRAMTVMIWAIIMCATSATPFVGDALCQD